MIIVLSFSVNSSFQYLVSKEINLNLKEINLRVKHASQHEQTTRNILATLSMWLCDVRFDSIVITTLFKDKMLSLLFSDSHLDP